MGFPGSSAGKKSACNAGDPGSISMSGRFPEEGKGYPLQYSRASLVAQMVKNLPAMQETWVRSLGQKDLLEKAMATHSSILAWRIPWTEEPGRLQSEGLQKGDTPERLSTAQHICVCVSFPPLKKMFIEPQIYHSEESRPYNYYKCILSKSVILRMDRCYCVPVGRATNSRLGGGQSCSEEPP